MESQIKISLKIPGPCRIPTDGPRGRGSVPPPWVSAGNIKSGAELSLNTALHFSMRTHPSSALQWKGKMGIIGLWCNPWIAVLSGTVTRTGPRGVPAPCGLPQFMFPCQFYPIVCGISRGFSAPLKPPPPDVSSGGGGLLCPCFTVPAPRAPPRGAARPPVRCSPPPRYWWAPVRAELPPDNTPPAHPVQRTDRATENIPP